MGDQAGFQDGEQATDPGVGRKGRRSRAEREAERDGLTGEQRSTLVRKINTFDAFDQSYIDEIHDAAMRVIEDLGIEFRDDESLEIWRNAGAIVEGANVRVPRAMIMELINKAPSEFNLHARNPERTVRIGGRHSVTSAGYGAPFVQDFHGERRSSTFDDLCNFYKLTHVANALHINGGVTVEPQDIDVELRHLHMVRASFELSDKPILGPVTSKERAQDAVDMSKLVFGDEFVDQNAVMVGLINSNAPRVWDETMLDAMKVYARNNQVFMASTFTMIAASMPASEVAAMALSIAEGLSAIALSQIIRPGAPAILGIPAGAMSMRTGAPVLASPSVSNFMLLAGQMARFYKLPLRATSHPTSSKWADMYAGIDATLSGFATHSAGANFLVHSAGMIDGLLTMSYMKFGLDLEITEIMHELMLGLPFETADDIIDMIKNVEPGGHYIGEDYTRDNIGFTPRLQDYNTYEQWLEEGCIKADQRGLAHTQKLLSMYKKPQLEATISQSLNDFVDRRTLEIKNTPPLI